MKFQVQYTLTVAIEIDPELQGDDTDQDTITDALADAVNRLTTRIEDPRDATVEERELVSFGPATLVDGIWQANE